MKIMMLGLIDERTTDAASIHFWEVAKAFARQGHTVTALAPRGDHARYLDQAPVKVIDLPLAYRENLLQAFVIGLVQLLCYARKADKDLDVVYIRWRLLPGGLVRLISRLRGFRPLIVSEHNGWVGAEVLLQRQSRLLAHWATLAQLLDAASCDKVITVTEGIRDLLASAGIRPAKIRAVGNGTNTTRFEPLADRDSLKRELLGHDCVTLGFIGHLARWQGLEDLLDCFLELSAAFPDLRLVIVGSGPCRPEIEQLIKDRQIADRVQLAGNIAYDQVNRWMNVIDIAFAPKTKQLEDAGYSPLKIRDYAAAGKVVVATSVKGIRELEPAGWLRTYNPDIPGDCARVVSELLQDPAGRRQMEARARQYALDHFDWDRVIEQISLSF